MHFSKKERNDQIKLLFSQGTHQEEIARKFNITQGRVSSIIHNRMPPYRYCVYCKDRLPNWLAICHSCRMKNYRRRAEKKERILKEKYERRLKREQLRKAKKEQAYRAILLKKLVKLLRRRSRSLKIPKTYDDLTLEARSRRLEKWQSHGRERIRFLVRTRDNFTCQDCGTIRTPQEVKDFNDATEGKKGRIKSLDVHHTNGECGKNSRGYDKREAIYGLITLCHKCHFNRHDWQPRLKKEALKAQ